MVFLLLRCCTPMGSMQFLSCDINHELVYCLNSYLANDKLPLGDRPVQSNATISSSQTELFTSFKNLVILEFLHDYLLFSLAHKSENVYTLSDFSIRDHDVRTYFTGPQGRGKIFHFAGSGHRRILELWGGSLLSRDP